MEVTYLSELPGSLGSIGADFNQLLGLIAQYDLVIIQRCYLYLTCKIVKDACDFLRKPLVFETDDDYFHLPETNPGFKPIVEDPTILGGYAEVLKMVDAVTVSTQELKNVIYRFNKNVHVFPNNIDMIYCGEYGPPRKGESVEKAGDNGKLNIKSDHGLITIPSYYMASDDNMSKKTGKTYPKRVVRVGYTGTPTHKEDFETIARSLEKVIEKYKGLIWNIFIGDEYFYQRVNKGIGRLLHIKECPYQLYMFQIRNFDIGIAPLAPNLFNMSKSPIKAIEYASWGIPSILPNYITYTREFTNGVNCLTYNNSREFTECLDTLIGDENLRLKLGQAARDHVRNNRLERSHAERRFNFYRELIEKKGKLFRFLPDLKTEEVLV